MKLIINCSEIKYKRYLLLQTQYKNIKHIIKRTKGQQYVTFLTYYLLQHHNNYRDN